MFLLGFQGEYYTDKIILFYKKHKSGLCLSRNAVHDDRPREAAKFGKMRGYCLFWGTEG